MLSNDPVTPMDDSIEPDAHALPEIADHAMADGPFPWPPVQDENVLLAAGETWRMSVFEPARFFSSMPPTGYLAALAYAIPMGIIGAGLDLFWSSTFAVMGVSQTLTGWWPSGVPANPSLQRLMIFLISPLSTLLLLLLSSALIHATLILLGAARRPIGSTLRVLCFALGPTIFAVVPVVGQLVGSFWGAVLIVIGLRETQATSTARAIAALVIPLLFLLAASVFIALLLTLGTALGLLLGGM